MRSVINFRELINIKSDRILPMLKIFYTKLVAVCIADNRFRTHILYLKNGLFT